MGQLKFGSAGITANEIDLSAPVTQEPQGTPAGIIGTSLKGRAFVPITVGNFSDWQAKFGTTDGEKFGPLAVNEWLRYAQSVTYLRVLGVGDGTKRVVDGNLGGSVTDAGFVVGEELPNASNDYLLGSNSYANVNGVPGRSYFLGCFMSESAGSTVFSSAKIQNSAAAIPIIRGMIMAPSGVVIRLSSSAEGTNSAPASNAVAVDNTGNGFAVGAVNLFEGTVAKQEFVLLLNGHKGTDPLNKNYITASFDMTSPNYFANVLNSDPYKIQEAGHFLYANWDIYPSTAAVTGSGIVVAASGAGGNAPAATGKENCAFILTSSLARNVGSATVPNYENWEDRFGYAKSPWVISQNFGGLVYNLFRLHSIDAGANTSALYKVAVENIVTSADPNDKFCSFDVVLRQWNDRDTEQKILEAFRGVNLDPNSDRYIAKVIGDINAYYDFDRNETSQRLIIDGNYSNNSNYVRVEVSTDVDNETLDPSAMPMGYRGIYHLVTSGSAPLSPPASTTQLTSNTSVKSAITPPLPMRYDITKGSGNKKSAEPLFYWGTQFEHVTSLATVNGSTLKNDSLKAFAKYYPDFATTTMPVVVGNNEGEVDTAANGIVDADRFCNNKFTLENVQVVTGSTTLADSTKWSSAVYVRDGNITTSDANKTRRLSTNDFTQANRRYLKFTFPMQGGWDGVNIFDEEESKLTDVAVLGDMNDSERGLNNGPNVKAYTKAIEIMKNTVNAEIQLLAIPGIRQPIVSDTATIAVEDRFDALYIMDLPQYDMQNEYIVSDSQLPSVSNTKIAHDARALDSSFAAAYFPDVVVQDPTTKTNVVVPPSVVILGALALNDKIGYPWFAPAGFTRGALGSTLEARVRLSKNNMDSLYDSGINPIVAFPGNNQQSGVNPKGGVTVWGQKTLQVASSALDRVNVRRLLIELRRQVRDVARTIVFEPSREATLSKFTSIITPKFQRVQALAGLERFKIVVDSSSTTQQDIQNNTLRGKIYVKPTKTIEFVSLDFVVTNNIED